MSCYSYISCKFILKPFYIFITQNENVFKFVTRYRHLKHAIIILNNHSYINNKEQDVTEILHNSEDP